MRNNSAQCAEDEREIIYFDFRTFGAAAPHLRPPRRAPAASIGRACSNTPVSSRAERGIPRRDFATYIARFFATLKMTRLKYSKNHNSQLVTHNFFHTRIMRGRHARASCLQSTVYSYRALSAVTGVYNYRAYLSIIYT